MKFYIYVYFICKDISKLVFWSDVCPYYFNIAKDFYLITFIYMCD